jgi:MYXO-CTERM domain-containing protein
MAALTVSAKALAQVPYAANFNTGAAAGPEWSFTTIDTTPSGQRYLGQLGAGTVTLNLGVQPAGSYTLAFDFYAIQSLDGNGPAGGGPDNFQFTANGTNLFLTNFDNFASSGQAYPQQLAPFGPGGANPAGTGAIATNSLGYSFGGALFADATYAFSLTYAHTGGNLSFGFTSFQNQPIGDEGWGLDNVSVVPAPTSAAALGLLLAAGIRRRR